MYVDAYFDRGHDRINVVERVDGRREYREFPANYVFYYNDPRGKFQTIYGNRVSRFSTRNGKEFQKELKMHGKQGIWESDINPVFRCLAENYLGVDAPELQTCFFDIEVDFDPERGYSSTDDPFNAITSISLYLNWINKLVTLAVPPKSLSMESAKDIVKDFDNTILFERESEMLKVFLDLIDDADILSGWNSEGYDIPYTVNRITRVLSKDDTRRFCLWGQLPRERKFERFGKEQFTFDIIGRQHLDYMQLYRKYTYHEMHSYSLDAIGEYELGERKVAYEGTLDQLYNQDFYTFIDYNRQDTMLLYKLDTKLKFIDLSNELAHANTVLLPTTMGAVAVTEQAIINEAHEQGLIVPNKKEASEKHTAAGAYVANPKVGMHEWIGSIDLNSLYPSAIRALNMAPETIVGQLRPIMTDNELGRRIAEDGASFAASWENMFGTLEYTAVMEGKKGVEITIDWESGGEDTLSAAEVWRLIFDSNNPWILTANGTIFTYEKKGVIPALLERWYAERKELQAKMREATGEERAFWDKRQLVKKINLNSLYGAILNPYCRFFDRRIGQSTTLTGRCIAKHMSAKTNELLTGKYDHVGDTIIYGDTDSVYFSAWPVIRDQVERGEMRWGKDECVALYDTIADEVNTTFTAFMEKDFHCPRKNGEIIAAGREIIGSRGIFITKKRYAVLVYDQEGYRTDKDGKPGKVKAMGLDLKRSDTPKVMQDFMSDLLEEVLDGKGSENAVERILEFKRDFANRPGWEKGTPKRVNNLTKFTNLEWGKEDGKEVYKGKANMPGHVRAAINWNRLKKMHSDNYSMNIVDGMKTIVCKLKDNPMGYTSVGYPVDELNLPKWFRELPFDHKQMEATIVDQKIENLLGELNWDLTQKTQIHSTFEDLFIFE
jgi:DNA polymerase elongation subunit (family B)